jgi:pyridoxine/pyridoxamine 5'-phosphate oxidase
VTAEKVREDRLRRAAKRQGLRLIKSRTRDPRARDYGGYWLMDDDQGHAHGPVPQGMTLDEVEEFLNRPRHEQIGWWETEQGRTALAQTQRTERNR